MIRLVDKENVDPATATWPYGIVVDDTGSDDGTRLNQNNLSDYFQVWEKVFDESGLTANGLLDNDTNGFQLYDALLRGGKPYDVYTALISQTGTNDPTVVVLRNELSGAIVWTRDTDGIYNGELTGAFPSGLVWCSASSDGAGDTSYILRQDDDNVQMAHYDNTAAAFDDQFSNISIEIRVYRS